MTVTLADLYSLPPSPARDLLITRTQVRKPHGSTLTGDWNPPRWVRQILADAEQHRLRAEAARYAQAIHAPATATEIAWAEAQQRQVRHS